MSVHDRNKALIAPIRAAMYDFGEGEVRAALAELIAPGAVVHMPWPLGDMEGPGRSTTLATGRSSRQCRILSAGTGS